MRRIYFLQIVLIFISNIYSQNNDNIFNEYQMQPEVWHMVQPEFGQVDAKGDLTEAGLNALNKTAPIVLELMKIAEYQFIDHGEWIIQ